MFLRSSNARNLGRLGEYVKLMIWLMMKIYKMKSLNRQPWLALETNVTFSCPNSQYHCQGQSEQKTEQFKLSLKSCYLLTRELDSIHLPSKRYHGSPHPVGNSCSHPCEPSIIRTMELWNSRIPGDSSD